MSTQGKLLYEGKAKQIFESDSADKIIVRFTDNATAFNGKKKEELREKGVLNNAITNILFKELEKRGVETHLVEVINDREVVAKKVDIIPLEVVGRNIVAGSLAKRTGLTEGTEIKGGIVEFYYKNDDLGDPLLNKDHIFLLNLASEDELQILEQSARKINDILVEIFKSIGLKLVDFKLEFGKYQDRIILADEISPDTCRLWDIESNKIMDKDRFRKDMGEVTSAYEEVLERLKTLKG